MSEAGTPIEQATPARLLDEIADVCEAAPSGNRHLDAHIAITVFPGLAELERIDAAVWRHPDGSRIRALRYSFSESAAASLLPPGYWLERDPILAGRINVHGPHNSDGASAQHVRPALAISAAALRARARAENRNARHRDGPTGVGNPQRVERTDV